ncbi:MAG: peptidase [Acidobacteriota bacterium]
MKGAIPLVLCAAFAMGAEPTPQERWKQIADRFSPTELSVDLTSFSPRQKQAIFKLVEAAKVVDEIFWDQKGDYVAERRKLAENGPPDLRLAFSIFYGPYDQQNEDASFFGDQPKLPGADFYPPDITAQEFEKYIAAHPELKEAFQSPYTVIRRDGKELKAVPYHELHREKVEQAAKCLEDACSFLEDPALVKYLRQRAADLRTDNYYQSDCDWIDLKDNRIEIVIGPYEVYEDNLLGLKAAYEAFVYAIDRDGSAKLSTFVDNLAYMQKSLPVPAELLQTPPGIESPLRVVNLLFSAGDPRQGVQTAAFNLPNDEKVRQEKGSKKIMLRNVMRAKFDKVLMPMATIAFGPKGAELVQFEPFFNNILLHEISHALGVGFITRADGSRSTPNLELKDLYAAMEEAKADVVGLYCAQRLMEKNVLPPSQERAVYVSFVASVFRSIRFGVAEAHGLANIIQLNFFINEGGLTFDKVSGTWQIDTEKMKTAVARLAEELLRVQYKGDYTGAAKLVADYGKVSPEVERTLVTCSTVPIDILPIYPYDRRR